MIEPLKHLSVSVEIDSPRGFHSVTFGVLATAVSGVVETCEPDKFSAWKWFRADEIPTPLSRLTAAVLSALATRAKLGFTPFIKFSPGEGEFVKIIV